MASDDPLDQLEPEGPHRDEPGAARALRRLNDLLGSLEIAVLVVLIAILVAGAVYQVLADRAFDRRETWPYEVIRYGVFFVAMTGAALAAQRRGMFHMDLVTRMFPPRLRAGLRIMTALLAAAMCGLVMSSGLDLRRGTHEIHEGFELVSTAHGYTALVVGFGLIALHFLLHGAIEVIYLAGGKLPPEPPHGGH
ncbi:MAG TPA: TRAP transporter small permease subunit [Candidatus Acidoferrum sp.]|nr:TRAP transporter small permease subunit [Candidatus Acidoferrum sp.]